jgi:hypothetical protein
MEPSYTYLFIRQDLCLEQQIIQTAHAIHLVGLNQKDKNLIPNAVLIGVRSDKDLIDICEYLEYNRVPFELFWESDIEQYTAIATYPLKGDQRKPFGKFNTLKVEEEIK